mgnify:CR=1 FL=1
MLPSEVNANIDFLPILLQKAVDEKRNAEELAKQKVEEEKRKSKEFAKQAEEQKKTRV